MKLKQLQKQLRSRKLDACLIYSNDPNFYYLVQERIDDAVLYIPAHGKPSVCINRLGDYNGRFRKRTVTKEKGITWLLKDSGCKTLGINEATLSVKQYKVLKKFCKLRTVNSELTALRLEKTPLELGYIREACKISCKIIRKLFDSFDFKTEEQVRQFLKIGAIREHCEPAFEPVVASASNAAIPHYAGDSRVKKGFLLVDFGVRYRGYCSDITRMAYYKEITNKERQTYSRFLAAQEHAISLCKEGVRFADIEKAVRKMLGKDARYFSHGLGHGLGIEIHEAPWASVKSDDRTGENSPFTIEPGYYHKFGLRIEDTVVLQNGKMRVLTPLTKELIKL